MPGLLLLIAADALLRGPSHALAWRLLHDPQLVPPPGWLRPWVPAGAPFDRDPLALLIAGGATLLAAAYLASCLAGFAARVRAALLAAAFGLVVLLPSALYVSVGAITGRPFGQDGGVVQLPLALELLLEGRTPYGADYSDSMLGKQSRASAFWRGYGANPIVRHHAYLPGTHLVMLPPYLAARLGGVPFDTRMVTLLALGLAALLAAGLFEDAPRKLSAAALVAVNPLVYWHQAFGANDLLFVAMLLAAVRLLSSGRAGAGGALLGLACATKQLAWPFAPFLLLTLRGPALRRASLAGAGAFALVVAPVAALGPRALVGDIVLYNVGLGGDLYPFGGTPGLGFANFVLAGGGIRSLDQPFSFAPFLLLLAPLGWLLLRGQRRRPDVAGALAAGSVALLAGLFFSRVPHANYLIAPAVLLPLAALLGRIPGDAALVPMLLLSLAAATVERGAFQLLAQDVGAVSLSSNPLDLAYGAAAAGLAVAYAAAAVLGAGTRARAALALSACLALVALPACLVFATGVERGAPRAQAAGLVASPNAREAWSTSFRSEPPGSPQPALATRALAAAGVGDGRLLGLLALAAALVAAARLVPAQAPAVIAVAALVPATVLGSVFGSDVAVRLALMLAALAAAARGSLATARGVGALLGVLALLEAALTGTAQGAGLGLANLAAYAGWEGSGGLGAARAIGYVAAAAAAGWVWRRSRSLADVLAGLALSVLLALACAPAAAPFQLGLPAGLLGLAVLAGSQGARARA